MDLSFAFSRTEWIMFSLAVVCTIPMIFMFTLVIKQLRNGDRDPAEGRTPTEPNDNQN